MRQEALACNDQEKIESFLINAQTGFLGLAEGQIPYVVPMNFIWHNGAAFFHGASEGRKIEIMKQNVNASLVVCENFGTLANPVPAKTDTSYMSAMVSGKIQFVTDLTEATKVMQLMLNKYVPGYYDTPLSKSHVEKYRSSLGSKTLVIKLVPQNISAKENPMNEGMKFYTGRSVKTDL
ncbi:pyridoxamine 5'-phosphate oxidase family protein [Peribacillus saganii]|uniref:Pyridoxamine 5'-phosphate oxidase family protein n=1 Tax=Peribacillus saganii TaxID=2303992 RepID=A0A372LNA7_9BACI|nr:pyridoxamine 5'-phosphate oxidase family protein [Peribacillus saganii]RFU68963.1 pyridoxamine 5'-phosphate oxidase family protein [Peribacillus saganii]